MSLQALYKNGCLNSVDGLYLPLPWITNCFSTAHFFFSFPLSASFSSLRESKRSTRCWNVARLNGFQWSEFTKGPVRDKAQLVNCTDRCTAVLKVGKEREKNKSSEKEKEADRRAVWRIGAPSDCVEKSFHLNAPLHPNNSSAAGKKTPCALPFPSFLCFTLLSEQLWRAPGCYPSGCLCARLMWVYAKRGLAAGLRGWLL